MCKIVFHDVVFYVRMMSEHTNYSLVKPRCSASSFVAVLFCLFQQKQLIMHQNARFNYVHEKWCRDLFSTQWFNFST